MVLPGTSAVKAVTAAAKDLETALLKLRKSKPFNATTRQPFDNMDNTLTATFNDMFATTSPTNTCDADLELSEDEHDAAQSEGCSLSRAAQSELFLHESNHTQETELHSSHVANPNHQSCEDNCFTYGSNNHYPFTDQEERPPERYSSLTQTAQHETILSKPP
jgi:hypothetical protein